MAKFDHLVCVDAAAREVLIYRVDGKGERTLYTKGPLPKTAGWSPELEAFVRQLGENLLIDSPAARRLLGL